MKKVVIGLGFGDEGKGLVTDWLASKNDCHSVIRYSGGHQAGHCVRLKSGEKHIFSNFGSGTLRGLPTFWRAKTVDPVGFCKEYELLKDHNPMIQIDPLCPVTTPWDKQRNQNEEEMYSHGSVGVGFGTTIKREEDNYHLYFKDLFYPWILEEKLYLIQTFYYGLVDISSSEITDFYASCIKITEIVKTDLFPIDHHKKNNFIYESSQGMMLDMDYGIFPHVTRSRVSTREIDITWDDEFYLVTRGYQTRHGNGPSCAFEYIPNNEDEMNVYSQWQGEFKTRILDIDILEYAITIDPKINKSEHKNLVITCLDQMETYSFIQKGIKYDFATEKEFVNAILKQLPEMQNVYLSHGPTAEDITKYNPEN